MFVICLTFHWTTASLARAEWSEKHLSLGCFPPTCVGFQTKRRSPSHQSKVLQTRVEARSSGFNPIEISLAQAEFRLRGQESCKSFLFHKQTIATRAPIYRSVRALRARNPEKVSKRVFWGSAENPLNTPPKDTKYPKLDSFRHFWGF